MRKFSFLPFFALVFAVGASAFTTIQQKTSTLVWFKLDPDTGLAADPDDGQQSATDPFSCDPNKTAPCSVALSLDEDEVIATSEGFSIVPDTDYTDPNVYNAMHYEDRP